MKIVHVCLCGPVTDGWTYQENLLTKYHKKNGHDVVIVTSQWIWGRNGKITLTAKTHYVNNDGVKMIRLPIKKGTFDSKFKRYRDLFVTLMIEKPEVLFIHGCQFVDIKIIVKYLKKYKDTLVFVDNHADFSNSATSFLSKKVLHGVIWRYYAQMIAPYVVRFYGVLPARVDFLVNVYNLQKEKVELLIMGADDELVQKYDTSESRTQIRKQYDIKEKDFLIITGGKIDKAKRQTLLLMRAIQKLGEYRIKLIVFGSVSEEIKEEMMDLVDNKIVFYAGWKTQEESYQMFSAADLVVFPGRHSVFWEQVAGQGIPMLVKEWTGTHHIDVGGNVKFLEKDSVDEIEIKLREILEKDYDKMKFVAKNKAMKKFSYMEIARKSIDVAKETSWNCKRII